MTLCMAVSQGTGGYQLGVNTLRPRQNGRLFADDTFKLIFLNENIIISIKISLKFVPKGPINNNPAWRRPGDKPLSEPMMVSLLTHICVTRPQWVNLWTLPRMENIFDNSSSNHTNLVLYFVSPWCFKIPMWNCVLCYVETCDVGLNMCNLFCFSV